MADNIGELFISLRAELNSLKKDINSVKQYLSKESSSISDAWKFKAKFDTSLLKLNITQLQSLRQKLETQFQKKLNLNIDSASLQRTKLQIEAVNNQLNQLKTTSSGFGGLELLKGFIGAAGLGVLTSVLKQATQNAMEARKAQMQVEQAVKQTGGVAGYTASELFKLANSLQKLSGIDDDVILTNITNQLLTFTNISGEVFSRAQKSILDLNAVISKGEVGALSSQAIQLGKALEDPIQGISALTRVGVTFTEQQKEQIEKFVNQNDLMSAQKIILDEIEAKYGNQAEALNKATGGIKSFQTAVGDLLEKIGAPLLNFFGSIATKLTEYLEATETQTISFDEQKKKVDNLTSTIPNLLSRYDELKSKTNLSNIEQEELKKIIKNIAESIPSAISQFNKYGEALDINTGKVTQYIEAERKRLAVIRAAEIETATANKKQLESERKLIEAELDRMLKTGKREITVTTAAGVIQTDVKVGEEGIKETQGKLKSLTQQIEGWEAEIKRLKGEPLVELGTIKTDKLDKSLEKINEKIESFNSKGIKKEFQFELGLSPEQVAQFEKLKFAVAGYVEYRQKLIEMEYKNEVEQAGNNAKLIEQATFNKNRKLAELELELSDYKKQLQEDELKSYQDTIRDIENENKKHLGNLEKQIFEYETNKQKAIDDYYSRTRIKDEDYFNWKIKKIQEESESLYLQTGDKLLWKQYEIEQLKLLEQEYLDSQLENLLNITSGLGAVLNPVLAGIESAYDTLWQTLTDTTMSGSERLENIFNAFKNAVIMTFADILKEYITKAIAQAIFADKMRVAEIAKGYVTGSSLLAAYAPAATAASIMTFGSAAGIGLAAYKAAMAASVISSNIPKFASGGEMIVPPGFPNDTFPALFSSGEKISVTKAGQVGHDLELLVQIDNSIKALTKTLQAKNTSPTIVANIDSLRFVESEVIPNIQRMNKSGIKI